MEENLFPIAKKQESALVEIESARAVQEVQAAMIIAKKFPRDQHLAFDKIMEACKRKSLAETATYVYPRGGKKVTGPSIRLAEVLAQNWGNMQFGVRELSQENGWSEVESFAWDVETNTRQVKNFKVPHVRHTKQGSNALTDPRDIYEYVASQGARRLRACILGVIPGDIVDEAVKACGETLEGAGGKPIEDLVRSMLSKFKEIGITQKMVEDRLQHKTSAMVRTQIVELGQIYNSINDGMSKKEDWFGSNAADPVKIDTSGFDAKLKKRKNTDRLDEFIKVTANANGIKEDELKVSAMEDFDGFWKSYLSWKDTKTKPEKESSKNDLSADTLKLIMDCINKDKKSWEQAVKQEGDVDSEEQFDKVAAVFQETVENK